MKAQILALFEKITVNDLRYCLLCFKTSEERKIKVSRHFASFLDTMNYNISLQWNNIAPEEKTTCFACEAKLEKALSLVKMVKNGMKMKNLLNYCQEYRKTNSLLNTCLTSDEPVEKLRNRHPMFMIAHECQKQLGEIQKLTELEKTAVLAIDTTTDSAVTIPIDKEDDDVVFIEDTPTPPPPDQNEKTNRSTKRKTQPKIKTTPSTNILQPSLIAKPTNVMTEPMELPSPITRSPLLLNSLLTPQKPIANNTDVTEFADKVIARQRADGNFELHKIVIGTDGVPYIPSLPAKLVNGQVVMINQVGAETINNASHVSIVLDPGINTSVAKRRESVDSVSKKRKSDPSKDNLSIEYNSDLVPEKQRVLKASHNTDWEDKIPMDVITYVDATDPNISSNIMQQEESILPDMLTMPNAPVKTDPDLIDITDEVLTPHDGFGIITSCYSERNLT